MLKQLLEKIKFSHIKELITILVVSGGTSLITMFFTADIMRDKEQEEVREKQIANDDSALKIFEEHIVNPLREENTNLRKEVNELLKEKAEWAKKGRDQEEKIYTLRANESRLQQQINDLLAENNSGLTDCNGLIKKHKMVLAERNNLQIQNNRLIAENNDLRAKNNILLATNNSLEEQLKHKK